MWIWKGQWPLDAWRNRLFTLALFLSALWLALPRGYSYVGVFNRRLDDVFVGVLRKWARRAPPDGVGSAWGEPGASEADRK